jgi:hypothetical protein
MLSSSKSASNARVWVSSGPAGQSRAGSIQIVPGAREHEQDAKVARQSIETRERERDMARQSMTESLNDRG